MVPKLRELTDTEQGQLADMIAGAGYMAVIYTLTSMAAADADGANETRALTNAERAQCQWLADELVSLEP